VLSVSLAATTTEVEEDVDDGPLGVLAECPTAATTKVEEDVDGGPPGPVSRYVVVFTKKDIGSNR
jgi:hypothetical protein